MIKTATILKTMQAVLLVTVLTPAISHADPLSTRQMLAQAQIQSQDQAVNGEFKKLNRGLILGTAEAATNPTMQRPVEIPQITAPVTAPIVPAPTVATVEAPQIEIPALPPRHDDLPGAPITNNTFATASAPAADTSTTATSSPIGAAPSIVTLPAPQPTTDASATTTPATTDFAATPSPVTPVAPVTVVPTPALTTTTVDSAKVDTTKTNTAKVDSTTAKPTSTKTAQASHQRHASDHSDDSVTVGGVKVNGGNFNGQLKTIMNRSDVKSILSQYGLN